MNQYIDGNINKHRGRKLFLKGFHAFLLKVCALIFGLRLQFIHKSLISCPFYQRDVVMFQENRPICGEIAIL